MGKQYNMQTPFLILQEFYLRSFPIERCLHQGKKSCPTAAPTSSLQSGFGSEGEFGKAQICLIKGICLTKCDGGEKYFNISSIPPRLTMI